MCNIMGKMYNYIKKWNKGTEVKKPSVYKALKRSVFLYNESSF